MAETPTIVQALAAVMCDVPAVHKAERNEHQNFNFRGIDATVNAVGPALRRHGVVVVPAQVETQCEQVEVGQKRSLMECVQVTVTYRFHGPAGDSLDVQVAGEAMDSGDKATPKAMSVAFRTALLQGLSLPTDEPDPGAESFERAAPAQSSNGDPPEPSPASDVQVARFDAVCDALDVDKRKALSDWMERNYGVDLDGFAGLSESWAESLLGHVEPQGAAA